MTYQPRSQDPGNEVDDLYYVSISTKHLKLLELLSTSSCVNLVTIALTVFKLHRGGGLPKTPRLAKVQKKPGLSRVKRQNWPSLFIAFREQSPVGFTGSGAIFHVLELPNLRFA